MLRKITFVLSSLLALLIAVLLVCAVFAVPIKLTPLHGIIERSTTKALSREVNIASIKLVPSLQPVVILDEIHIGNPYGWQQKDSFARIAQAQVKFDLLSLIQGKLVLQWIRGEDLELILAESAAGEPNWHFQSSDNTTDESTQIPISNLEELTLKQVAVHYRKAHGTAPDSILQLDELSARAAADTALVLKLQGQCLQQPCVFTARLGRSDTLLSLTPLQGYLGESTLNGQARLDLSHGAMALDAQLDISELDTRVLQLWWRDAALSSRIKGITLRANGQGADHQALIGNLDITLRAGSSRLSLERRDQTPLTLELSGTELALTPGKPLQIKTDGRLNDVPLMLGLTVDMTKFTQQAETESPALPVKLTGIAGDSKVSADGHIGKHGEQFTLDLQINADGPQFGKLTSMLINTQAPTLPYRMSAHLQYTGNTIKLEDLDARIGSSVLQGELSVSDIADPEQRLHAKLHSPVLNLTEQVTAEPENATPQKDKTRKNTVQKNAANNDESLKQAREAETALKLDKKQKRQVQTALTRLGFDTRGIDGIFGNNTRRAIRAFQENRQQTPSGFLNAEQLALLLDDRQPKQSAPGTPSLLDQPLPTDLDLINGDLELSIERLILPQSTEISALSITGQLHDGYLAQSSLQATLDRHPFAAKLMIDLRAQAAKLQLDLNTKKLNIGSLLRSLRIAEDIDLNAGQFNATLATDGTTLRELLAQSSIDATMTDGRWIVDRSKDNNDIILSLVRSTLKAKPGQPVIIKSNTQFGDTPLTVTLQGEPLSVILKENSWPVKLNVKSADGAITLNGTARLPVSRQQLAAQLKLSGTQLDRLGNLFDIALPPLGPYTIAATLGVEKKGYRLKDLKIDIGNSQLRGQLFLATGKQTPRLDLDLQAEPLQLVDFGVDLIQFVDFGVDLGRQGGRSDAGQTQKTTQSTKTLAGSLSDLGLTALDKWLTPELMRRINANVNLQAQRIVLDDSVPSIGPYSISASLQNGRLTIKRKLVNLAGGKLDLYLTLQPDATGIEAELKTNIDHLNYGRLVQQLAPGTNVGGHFTFNAVLHGSAPTIDTFLGHANGHIGFILQPDALEAGPLSLWEMSILTLLLPVLDSAKSKLNCVVGHFPIEDGVVKIEPGTLIIDTSRIRASGKGEINFKTQHIDITLIPIVKSTIKLDLSTPVRVRGDFSDFDASSPPGELIQTAAGVSLAVYAPWLLFFTWEKVPPADGSDICHTIPELVTSQPERKNASGP